MRSKAEIKQDLINLLSSNGSSTWSKLQNSLIGKELISFGAEVIAASDAIKDSLVQEFDYKFADERSLIHNSHVLDIAIGFSKPSYIKLHLGASYNHSAFAPFDIKYTVGNVVFTNISYVFGSEDIILYQGTTKSMASSGVGSANNMSSFCVPTVPWTTTQIPADDSYTITGHNIGNALVDSVYVFYRGTDYNNTSVVGVLSSFTPLGYGPLVRNYKLMTLMDKSIMVLDGDGVWGSNDYSGMDFQIIWLEPTNEPFDTTGSLMVSSTGSTITDFTVVGSALGADNSLEYARQFFRQFYLSMNAVVSKDQIKDFVNAYPFVQDCSVTASNDVVFIYVKPTDLNDSAAYDDVVSQLELHGEIQTKYLMMNGYHLVFRLNINGSISSAIKSQITNFIKDIYKYSALPFDFVPNVALISGLIQSNFGVNATVKFKVSDISVDNGNKLAFLPEKGSMLLYSNGAIVGYDINGALYASSAVSSLTIDTKCNFLGNYLYSGGKEYGLQLSASNTLRGMQIPDSVIETLAGVTQASNLKTITSNGYTFLIVRGIDRQYINILDNSQITPAGLLTNLLPISGNTPLLMKLDSTPFYYNGKLFGVSITSDSQIVLEFYTGSSAEPYYNYPIPIQASRIYGIYIDDSDNLFLFVNYSSTNRVVQVSRFTSNSISWSVLSINTVVGQVLGFSCYKQGVLALMSYSTDGMHVYRGTGMTSKASVLSITNLQDIGTFSFSNGGSPSALQDVMHCTEDYVFFSSGTTDILSRVVFGSTSADAVAFDMTVERPYGSLTSNSVVGSVNYDIGTISLASAESITLTYTSSAINDLGDAYFIKLDETNPIDWK